MRTKPIYVLLLVVVITIFTAGCLSDKNAVNTEKSAQTGMVVPTNPGEFNELINTNTETKWQDKLKSDAQISQVYNDSIKAVAENGKTLAPIETKEITLVEPVYAIDLSFTGISINRTDGAIKGFVKNIGDKATNVNSLYFMHVTKEYVAFGKIHIKTLNGIDIETSSSPEQQVLEPGQQLSFMTTPIPLEPQSKDMILELLRSSPYISIGYEQ